MDEIVETALHTILAGGPNAIVVILIGIVLALGWEIRRLRAQLSAKDDRINTIVDNYTAGAISTTEALMALRLVLVELKGRL